MAGNPPGLEATPWFCCSLNPLPIWEGNSETYHLQHTQQLLEATTDSLHYSFLVSKKPGILYSRIFLCSSYRISQSGPSAAPYAPFPIAFEFWAYFWHSLLDAFCWGWKSSKWNLWKLIVLLLCDSRKKKAKRIKSTWRNLNFFRRSLLGDCSKGKSRGLSTPSVSLFVSCLLA